MNANGMPIIVPGQASIMGQVIEVVADVDPEKYPAGIEVVLYDPRNRLVPIGGGVVNVQCMLGIVPPAWSNQIRGAMKAQPQRQLGPGEVRAPGLG